MTGFRSWRRVVQPPGVLLVGAMVATGPIPAPPQQVPTSAPQAEPGLPAHEFTFARAAYSGFGGRGFRAWSTDFPKADRQFLIGIRRLTGIDASPSEWPLRLDDPDLRRFPFLYAVEVGWMSLTEAEVAGLRDYLRAGGFLLVDDFWGTAEWANFERQIRRVLPDRPIVEIPSDHPMFRSLYRIDEIVQVPNVQQGIAGGRTWERDGYQPRVLGIFDEADRLMVAVVWNSDLGDAWEWADHPMYPLRFSTFAYEMGINVILYGMSH